LKNRVSIKIGHLGQPLDELAKNLNEVVAQLRVHCPGGTANIQSLYLQPTSSSPSLPIYVNLDSRSEISMESPKKYKHRLMEEGKQPNGSYVSGELSTLPEGLDKVFVHPDGRVRVMKDGKEVDYPTLDDEHEARDDILPPKKTKKSAEAITKKRTLHRTKRREFFAAKKTEKAKKKTKKTADSTATEDNDVRFKFRPLLQTKKNRTKKNKGPGAEGAEDTASTTPSTTPSQQKGKKKPSATPTPAGNTRPKRNIPKSTPSAK